MEKVVNCLQEGLVDVFGTVMEDTHVVSLLGPNGSGRHALIKAWANRRTEKTSVVSLGFLGSCIRLTTEAEGYPREVSSPSGLRSIALPGPTVFVVEFGEEARSFPELAVIQAFSSKWVSGPPKNLFLAVLHGHPSSIVTSREVAEPMGERLLPLRLMPTADLGKVKGAFVERGWPPEAIAELDHYLGGLRSLWSLYLMSDEFVGSKVLLKTCYPIKRLVMDSLKAVRLWSLGARKFLWELQQGAPPDDSLRREDFLRAICSGALRCVPSSVPLGQNRADFSTFVGNNESAWNTPIAIAPASYRVVPVFLEALDG